MSIHQHNVQQMSVAANLAAIEQSGDILREELEKADEASKAKPAESVTKQLLEATGRKARTRILADLIAKLGDTFIPKKMLNKMQREYGSLFEDKGEDFTDKIDLKSLKNLRAKASNNKLVQQAKDDASPLKSPGVREYLQSYTSLLVSGGNEIKKKVDAMEQKLIREGKLKVQDLNQLRSQAARTVRQEILEQVKRAFHKQIFASGKLEQALTKHGTQKIIDWAFFNEKIGGYDFGGEHGHLQNAIDEIMQRVGEEAKDTIQEEMTKNFIKKQVSDGDKSDKSVEKDIGELLKLGQKVGFDFEGFVKTLPKLADDLGLIPIIETGVGAEASMDEGGDERKSYQYSLEEERDILMEEFRVFCMRKAVYGDWRTNLEMSFRMVKTKNGLIKLGLRMEDFSRLEAEGKELAKLKLVQMLREGFEERATYAKLSGPAWKMTEKKIKMVLRNLEKLGVELSDKDIKYMIDKANEKMFAEAQHELSMIEAALETRQSAYLMQKRKIARQILERVSEESNIPWNNVEKSSIIEGV